MAVEALTAVERFNRGWAKGNREKKWKMLTKEEEI